MVTGSIKRIDLSISSFERMISARAIYMWTKHDL